MLLSAAYYRVHSSPVMEDTAMRFLASLSADQKAKALFTFADEERFDWHYIPKARKGLPVREMSPDQKLLAHALLNAGLSQQGYIKATSIMSLDAVLKVLEHGTGPVRDPEGYFFSIFGEPSGKQPWGYRVEGHHLSLNFTISQGKVIGAPTFFGANPAKVLEGPRAGLRVLGREEDLGRAFVSSLTADQQKTAIVDATAPKEILTEASRQAALKGQASGISASKLTAHQHELLDALLEEYCHTFPDDIAEYRLAQVKKAGGNLFFAWEGGLNVGDPHYYRIQSPDFLIEYDDTQNNANHIHTVWRDFHGDFGADLLQEHYTTSHNGK
jgi:hypothetical protein